MLPLLGAIGGTVIGARVGGPAGGLGGQFLGQSIATSAEDLIDTYAGGHTFAQERAGQALGSGRGGREAIDEFTDALKNALTPAAKELAETLTAIGRAGPVSAAAAGEFGQYQFAMGTAFSGNASTEAQFLSSSPFLVLRAAFGTAPLTGLSTRDFVGNATAAALSGDYSAMRASEAFADAQMERGTEASGFQQDSDFKQRFEGESLWEKGRDYLFQPTRVRAYSLAKKRLTNEPRYTPGSDAARAALASQEAGLEDMYAAHEESEASVSYAGSLIGVGSTNLKTEMALGGDAGAIYAALPGIGANVQTGISALDSDIALNTASAAQFPKQAAFLRAQSAPPMSRRKQNCSASCRNFGDRLRAGHEQRRSRLWSHGCDGHVLRGVCG